MVLLRGVGQVEVARERAGDLLGTGQREAGDELLGLRERLGVGPVVRPDRELAQPLDVGQQVVAARLAQHPAEELAEHADVVAQRLGHLVVGRGRWRTLHGVARGKGAVTGQN